MTAVRVLLVEDHPATRLGVRAILETDPTIEVVGEADTVAAAIDRVRETRPDVVLLDLRLPDAGAGLAALDAVRAASAEARVIVLTGLESVEHGYRALAGGALGYLTKSVSPRELVDAVHAVARGRRTVQRDVAAAVASRAFETELTKREREVLELVAEGRTNGEIALVLEMSAATVRTHVARVLEKLGAADRTEAAAMAIRRGLI